MPDVAEKEAVFWADAVAERLANEFPGPQVVEDEKTPSGRIHLGSLRGFVIHQILYEAIRDTGLRADYLLGSDDFDELDKIPVYWKGKLDEKWLGVPVCDVPSPSGNHKSYAEEVRSEIYEHFESLGLTPKLYNTSEKYKDGTFNEAIRIALDNAAKINEINRRISGAQKAADSLPFKPVCPVCGKINTAVASDWDGNTVAYDCRGFKDYKGCGSTGRKSPFDGGGKLPWKVEWAAKFKAFKVTCEYAGKDHYTRGGSREVSDEIARAVYGIKPPFGEGYEFVLLGKKKMSSSAGIGESAADVLRHFDPKMVRFLFVKTRPNFQLPFDPSGPEVARLYDEYDRIERVYYGAEKEDNEREKKHLARVYELSHVGKAAEKMPAQVNFSFAASLVQIARGREKETLQKLGHLPAEIDGAQEAQVMARLENAKKWLDNYAPDEFRMSVLQQLPGEAAGKISGEMKELFELAASELENGASGETLQTKVFYEGAKARGLQPKEVFRVAYLLFLGKERGPRLGEFLSSLDRAFAAKRLRLQA